MKKRYAANPLLFSVAILALAACSEKEQETAPKTAATTQIRNVSAATDAFKKSLDLDSKRGTRVTLWNDMLAAGDAVGESGGSDIYRPDSFEWFALIDPKPGAYFNHPVAYAFVSYADGSYKKVNRVGLPLLNQAPLWNRVSDLLHSESIAHSDCWFDHHPYRTPESDVDASIEDWPPRMAADQCPNQKRTYALLIHNIPNVKDSPETIENLEFMAEALKAAGYSILEFAQNKANGENKPYLNLSRERGAGIYQIKNFVNIHRDYNDCCEEIIVYITGETAVDNSGRHPAVYLTLPFGYPGEHGDRKPMKAFFPEDFATFFSELKTCHVNVVVDTNNAVSFVEDLLTIPQTESVTASCQMDEYTYSAAIDMLADGVFVDRFATQDGEKGSEFTSSFAKGILEYAQENPDPDDFTMNAHRLVEAGWDAVLQYDLTYIAGQTTPTTKGRIISSDCPCGIDNRKM